ncbi:unnamed protein product, partial [Vitis vinifera]|uniref:Uncharacterized protein n=1 Tax=Vitis vinifera TaxID=29760 RepID=D7U3T6_VITVI
MRLLVTSRWHWINFDFPIKGTVFSNHYLFLGLSYDPTFVLQTYGAIEVHQIWLFIKSYLQVLNGAPKLWLIN